MDFIVGAVVLLIVGAAMVYIRKEKKRGVKCIGCPAAGTCSQKHHSGSECSCHADT